jgi:hypothetical protein
LPIKRREENRAGTALLCLECGADLRAQGWPSGTPVHHCEGGLALFARIATPHLPHHCPVPVNPRCWKCDAPMGCARCAGPAAELICRRCKVLANKAALLARGVLRGQTLADYPPQWHAEYAARRFGALFEPASTAALILATRAPARLSSAPTAAKGG